MFGMNLAVLAMAILVMLSVGGIAYALLFDKVNDDAIVAKRIDRVLDLTGTKEVEVPGAATRGKRSLQTALKEFEEREKAKEGQRSRPPLSMRITQAGLDWTKQTYTFVSIGIGVGFGFLILMLSGDITVTIGAIVVGGLGIPSWLLKHLAKRRQRNFTAELPTAIDLIVRGVRSGLPLGDCLRMVANECKEPVKGEFRTIMEAQQMGVPVGDACLKLFDRMPLQEANFFGIVIAIQQKAGGNLSEALGNLSNVLRERRKMQEKIQAMSMEAKASAAIIGSLPFVVGFLVFLTSPNYIKVLFATTVGNLILVGGGIYMIIGILVMRQMINFDF